MTLNSDNRFERWAKNAWMKVLIIALGLAGFLFVAEIGSYTLTRIYYSISDRNPFPYHSRLLWGSLVSTPPVNPKAECRYVGHLPDPAPSRVWHMADPVLGHRLGRGVCVTRSAYKSKEINWNMANKQGLAVAGLLSYEYPKQKPPGEYRIIIFGGSTVEGNGAKNPLENLPSNIQYLLDDFSSKLPEISSISVINAGVGGYVVNQQYLYLTSEMISYDPDMVIFYDGWNDWNWMIDKNYTTTRSVSNFSNTVLTDIYDFFNATASGFLIKRIIEKLFLSSDAVTPDVSHKIAYRPEIVRSYTQTIMAAAQFSRSHGFVFVHVLQPLIGVDNRVYQGVQKKWLELNKSLVELRRRFYRDARLQLAAISRAMNPRHQACFLDLSRSLELEQDQMYEDSGHLNGKGNLVVAKRLMEGILECGSFPWLTK